MKKMIAIVLGLAVIGIGATEASARAGYPKVNFSWTKHVAKSGKTIWTVAMK